MDTANEQYGLPNRLRFFRMLMACVLMMMMACLLWMGSRAMAHANPWFTDAGIAAVVYLASVFINYRRILRQSPWKFALRSKPVLRIVK